MRLYATVDMNFKQVDLVQPAVPKIGCGNLTLGIVLVSNLLLSILLLALGLYLLSDFVEIRCQKHNDFAYGNIHCSNANLYMSTCTFDCEVGYELEGEPTTTCQANKTWSTSFPQCSSKKKFVCKLKYHQVHYIL